MSQMQRIMTRHGLYQIKPQFVNISCSVNPKITGICQVSFLPKHVQQARGQIPLIPNRRSLHVLTYIYKYI